ncbi:nucleotide-binding domain-containing protein [Tilletiaria anomala UBC 951]|uniref:NADPH:adrenodoxin oxidoreductase, mitochondrial n=1 Tax=Tilletiaria anomala (strain ATCC 24038 / CBS 436.72 / UBC 951) TaxID=1037660 RepID=A0A066VS21_TILAU|nr:nucleotide-binding domain-containing protein [Tilletiaria anomala UBC 951]KDN41604.1 nucleotide-binding domain-containing protein [Tilletiaria anomala UBC 951]
MLPSFRALAAQQALKLAVIGAGPSAFYASARVLSHFPAGKENECDVEVHMFERLPTPHGLVRYGVAPDHPEVKNVEHKFAEVAKDPRFHFYGNVNVGHSPTTSAAAYPLANHVPLSSLLPHYTHVLFAYGSSLARPLGIPGSAPGELANVHSALDFVNWYNGHPVAHDPSLRRAGAASFESFASHGRSLEHMTIIGAGNVALDVARIVLRASCSGLQGSDTPAARAYLAQSDVPEPVLAALSQSRINEVDIFARRGPAHVAFTNKELREMMALPGISFRPADKTQLDEAEQLVERAEHEGTERGSAEAKSGARVKMRLLSLLAKGSQTKYDPAREGKSWGLNFFRAPAALSGPKVQDGPAGPPRPVRQVTWNLTQLPNPRPVAAGAEASIVHDSRAWGNPAPVNVPATGEQEKRPTDLVISSIGYRSESIAEAAGDHDLPFDDSRAVVPNEGGRVTTLPQGKVVPGHYVSGWLARGPVGVIASTMYDAYSVADLLVQDWQQGVAQAHGGADGLPAELRQPTHKVVTYKDWQRIDSIEKERGAKLGKLREKILTVQELLEVAS